MSLIFIDKKWWHTDVIEKIIFGESKKYYLLKHPTVENYVLLIPDTLCNIDHTIPIAIKIWENFKIEFERYPKIVGKRFSKIKMEYKDFIIKYDITLKLKRVIASYLITKRWHKVNLYTNAIDVFFSDDIHLYSYEIDERKLVNTKNTKIISVITEEEMNEFQKLNLELSNIKYEIEEFLNYRRRICMECRLFEHDSKQLQLYKNKIFEIDYESIIATMNTQLCEVNNKLFKLCYKIDLKEKIGCLVDCVLDEKSIVGALDGMDFPELNIKLLSTNKIIKTMFEKIKFKN